MMDIHFSVLQTSELMKCNKSSFTHTMWKGVSILGCTGNRVGSFILDWQTDRWQKVLINECYNYQMIKIYIL